MLPDFAIGPFFSRDVVGDTEQNIGATISATVPLWDWNIGNIQNARARRNVPAVAEFRWRRTARDDEFLEEAGISEFGAPFDPNRADSFKLSKDLNNKEPKPFGLEI